MISIQGDTARVCDGTTRRELMRFGSLAMLGGAIPATAQGSGGRRFGQAKRLLTIYLFGGASQYETWDPKPEASAEIRGEFGAIETNVSGIRISGLAPNLAKTAQRFSLLRAVSHGDNTHDTAMYASYTGWPFTRPSLPPPSPDDRPSHGAIVSHFRRNHRSAGRQVPPLVALGGLIINNGEVPGQRGGLLGSRYNPFPIPGNPADKDFRVPELVLTDQLSPIRLDRRRSLLHAVDDVRRMADRSADVEGLNGFQSRAIELIGAPETRRALEISREDPKLRDRYGRTGLGQRLLLARRLFEAGVSCATVHWLDGDNSWDYHSGNFPGHKKSMAVLDPGVSALLQDLDDRGMLAETLVLVLGEFGRTAVVNATAGRDHWATCYSALLAGGGIQGGRVHGASDKSGAYPQEGMVGPWDIAATLYHLMGIDPEAEYIDLQNRPMKVSRGTPIQELL